MAVDVVAIARNNANDYHSPMLRSIAFCLWLTFATITSGASAAESEFTLVIRNHRFEPSELRVPAGKKIRIVVDNRDATSEEFESRELDREKVVPGHTRLPVYVGPLAPGRYRFVGEFHERTAKGVLIAE